MRELDALQRADLCACPMREHGGGILARPIHRQDGRCLKGRDEEGAGCMAKMVVQVVKTEAAWTEMLADELRESQHAQVAIADLSHPSVHACPEHVPRDRRGLDDLQELVPDHPWPPIETDIRHLADPDP